MKKLMLAVLAAVVLTACDGGTFKGTGPTVNADPNAGPGKVREVVKPVLKEGQRLCTEADAASFSWEANVLGEVIVENRSNCQAIVGISAARILQDPATGKPQADWGKEVFYGNQTDIDLAPGKSFALSIGLDPGQCWEVHGFIQPAHVPQHAPAKGDGWDESLSLQANGYYKPFGVAVRQVFAVNYDKAPDCNGGAYYPPQQPPPPPPPPSCATDPSLCPPPPPPPPPVCSVKGSQMFNVEIMQPYDDVTFPPNHVDNLPLSIPAGSYHMWADTFDDHASKVGQDQPNEQSKFVFKGAGGEVGSTGPTVDIPSGKNYQTSDLGVIVLSGDVSLVDIVHAGPNNGNPDSLTVVSLRWECVPTTPGPGNLTTAVRRRSSYMATGRSRR